MEHESIRRWIVGVDGSPGSEHAVRWAAAHAPQRTSQLHLVRAWQLPAIAGAEFGVQVTADLEPPTAYEELDALTRELESDGVQITSSVVYGGSSSTLLDASEDADLLVLGTRGLGGFRRLLLGSVSQQCATHARVPVVVVPGQARTDGVLDRVVVGVDGSAGSAAALRWALEFAPAYTRVQAVGIWTPSRWASDVDVPLFEEQSRQFRDHFDASIDDVEAAVHRSGATHRIFEYGDAADVLVEACNEADLLVVGERGHGGLSAAILGSVATNVLHHAPCATAVIPVS